VSDEERDRRQLEALQEEARSLRHLAMLGRLAGGVAHDFNTLLGTIRGYSEMLQSALPAGDALRHPVEQIHRAALRGAQVTRQLLLFSRRQEVQAQVVDLEKLLADVEVMFERLIGEDVQLARRVEPRLGRVWGDPGELHQVLLNLVVNACDAMPSGGTLTLALRSLQADHELVVEGGRLPPGPYVMLQVTDTGLGMTEEVRRRIFEPFFTTKPGGSGIGLSLARHVVLAHGGQLDVRAHEPRGSVFTVTLPAAQQN